MQFTRADSLDQKRRDYQRKKYVKRYLWLVLLQVMCVGAMAQKVHDATPLNISTSTATDKAGSSHTSEDWPESVKSIEGVKCTQAAPGWNLECTAGAHQIATYPGGCSARGSYGAVEAEGMSHVTDNENRPAELQNKQFVCVSADSREKGGPIQWYYVIAVSPQSVPGCTENSICGRPEYPSVKWIRATPEQKCQLGVDRKYTVGRARGWVSADEFVEFYMGLLRQGA